MSERRERRKFRRGHFREERHQILVALGMLAPPTPPQTADAARCDRCGQPMLLDAMGDMWMCANVFCGADALLPPAPRP